MDNSRFCYWCGDPAVSREHVPPRCFFPEELIRDGVKQKLEWNHLFTVPSCKEHNNRKSKDDEYLRAHIVPFALDNPYAQALFWGKAMRAWKRDKDLLRTTRFDGTNLYFDCSDNRIGFEIEGFARALYFVENKNIFIGKCYVFVERYSIESELHFRNSEAARLIIQDSSSWNTEVKGNYPSIFKYHLSPTDHLGSTALILTFYESFRIFAVLADEKHINERNSSISKSIQFLITKGIDPLPFLLGNQGYNNIDL